jgi:thiamine biosynthesis lipoprotein
MRHVLLVFIALALASCNTPAEVTMMTFQGPAFGTTYNIKVFTDKEEGLEKGIDQVIYQVNKSVSTYLYESDISKINRGDSSVKVDEIFKEVFRISETVFTNSKGYFDPTVGTLRNAYGFGEGDAKLGLTPEKLDSLRNFVGFRKVKILADGTVKKEHPSIYLDFNAVAKGYGIDLLGNFLESKNIDNYIIELGGEILAKGKNITRDKLWTAGVETIDSKVENRTFAALVALNNEGMAGSGNYRKFRIDSLTGKKYVHTINPLTGMAEASDVTSATVIAPTCALADAYATAFMAMGLTRSKEVIAQTEGVAAYLTFIEDANTTGVFVSQNFTDKMLK